MIGGGREAGVQSLQRFAGGPSEPTTGAQAAGPASPNPRAHQGKGPSGHSVYIRQDFFLARTFRNMGRSQRPVRIAGAARLPTPAFMPRRRTWSMDRLRRGASLSLQSLPIAPYNAGADVWSAGWSRTGMIWRVGRQLLTRSHDTRADGRSEVQHPRRRAADLRRMAFLIAHQTRFWEGKGPPAGRSGPTARRRPEGPRSTSAARSPDARSTSYDAVGRRLAWPKERGHDGRSGPHPPPRWSV